VSDRLYRVPASGGPLAEIPESVNLDGAGWWRLDYVPTANAVIGSVSRSGIVALFLDSGTRKVIADGATTARYVASGHLVLQRGDALYLTAIDPVTLEPIGAEVPLNDRVRMDGATGDGTVAQFDVADNGDILYMPPGEIGTRLYLVDREGRAEPLDFPAVQYGPIDVAPDGRRVLSSELGSGEYLLDLERGTRTALTSATMRVGFGAVWSGDGEAFVGTGRWEEQRALIEVGSDGAENVLLNTENWNVRTLATHPNQTDVLFSQAGTDIYLLDLVAPGSEPRPLIATPAVEHSPAVSPDGKWLAYVSNGAGTLQVYIRRYPGGTDQVVSQEFAVGPVWSTDSSELYFQGDLDGQSYLQAVKVSDPGTGQPALSAIEPLFPLRTYVGGTRFDLYAMGGNQGVFYDVLPDGRFLMERSMEQTRLTEAVLLQNLQWPPTVATD